MGRKKVSEVKPSYFETVPHMVVDGFDINAGDIIKIQGQYGSKFKFIGVTKNNLTGSQWVDCFEIINGISSVFRSFKQEKVKRIPNRRKRAKRVV
jgi:hypothetical protein